MDGEVMAALIGGASGLAGALVGGTAALAAAKMAMKATSQTALTAYLGPLDTARRTAQREVFARFLTVSQEWTRRAEPAARAAEGWDRAVREHLERLLDEDVGSYVDLPDETVRRFLRSVSAIDEPHRIAEAAQHVLLEAAGVAGIEVVRAAAKVHQHAVRLKEFLDDAGKTHLDAPDRAGPGDPSNHLLPNPRRSPDEHAVLDGAIDAFARIAANFLNQRNPDIAPDAPVTS
jgi:hypothetical protein